MKTLKLRSNLGTPKILVIEDEVPLAEICRAVLSQAGADVDVVFDGSDAYDAIGRLNPNIILSDVKMPETRGDELLVSLLTECPDTPLILMTGLQRNRISLPQETPNLFSLIYKPLDYDQLIRTVQSAVDLIEARRLKELLLKQWYAQSASNEDFGQWQAKAMIALVDEWSKRRAS